VRWIVVAAVLALSSTGGNASESAIAENQSAEMSGQHAAADNAVTVTPISSHSMAVELVKELQPSSEMGASRKVAQKKPLPKSLLSRTERHQIALLVETPRSGEPLVSYSLNDEDNDGGADDLDLQSSFGRPKVAKQIDQNDEDRDQGLSDAVKLRLFLARMKAVKAHEKKFS
jgi:hypothetical protein